MSTEYTPNHEPLTIEEIVFLLKEARIECAKPMNGHVVSGLQVRLGRGVIGSTTPDDEESQAFKATMELYDLFMVFVESELIDVNAMAIVLYRLMTK